MKQKFTKELNGFRFSAYNYLNSQALCLPDEFFLDVAIDPVSLENGFRKYKEEHSISREAIAFLRSIYKKGTRIILKKMDDVQAPPVNTKGTVTGVDDIGTIHVKWDNGSGLGIAFLEDDVVFEDSEELKKVLEITNN